MTEHGTAAILIVEDDQFIGLVTLRLLQALGYLNVTVATNGAEAVQACTHTHFELILMDCDMPVMNGLDATRAIRSAGVRTPIVAYTASGSQTAMSLCIEAGMDDFLHKPAEVTKLAQKVHHWLVQSPGQ